MTTPMDPHVGAVYDILTLTPRRVIDPGFDAHPTLGSVPSQNPRYEALLDSTHVGQGEAMAIIPKSQVSGLNADQIARLAILRRTGHG